MKYMNFRVNILNIYETSVLDIDMRIVIQKLDFDMVRNR